MMVACASLATVGCQTSSVLSSLSNAAPVILPAPPAHVRACLKNVVPLPDAIRTVGEARTLLRRLRRSELAKRRCGLDALAYADAIKRALEGKGGG